MKIHNLWIALLVLLTGCQVPELGKIEQAGTIFDPWTCTVKHKGSLNGFDGHKEKDALTGTPYVVEGAPTIVGAAEQSGKPYVIRELTAGTWTADLQSANICSAIEDAEICTLNGVVTLLMACSGDYRIKKATRNDSTDTWSAYTTISSSLNVARWAEIRCVDGGFIAGGRGIAGGTQGVVSFFDGTTLAKTDLGAINQPMSIEPHKRRNGTAIDILVADRATIGSSLKGTKMLINNGSDMVSGFTLEQITAPNNLGDPMKLEILDDVQGNLEWLETRSSSTHNHLYVMLQHPINKVEWVEHEITLPSSGVGEAFHATVCNINGDSTKDDIVVSTVNATSTGNKDINVYALLGPDYDVNNIVDISGTDGSKADVVTCPATQVVRYTEQNHGGVGVGLGFVECTPNL